MAYDPNNPPSLLYSGIGGTEGMRFYSFVWVDVIGDVLAPGYISNASDLGMRVGDSLVYKDAANVGEWMENHLIITDIDANGAGSVGFPEVPEEALPLEPGFEPDDPNTYLVAFYGGRQVRILPSALLAGDVATQAEAEAGVENTKKMTPLRTKQAVSFQVPGLLSAQVPALIDARVTGYSAKTTPVDADALVITDSAASGAPKRLTWLNALNAIWTRLGGLIAGGTSKSTPVDADSLAISDSAASGATKRLTFANMRAWLDGVFFPSPSALYFLRRNAANNGNEMRSPAQVASDIGVVFTKEYVSADLVLGIGGGYTLPHGLGASPKLVQCRLKCVSAEGGYSVNDEVALNVLDDVGTEVLGSALRMNSTNIVLQLTSSGVFTALINAGTGGRFVITNANWRLIVRAWA